MYSNANARLLGTNVVSQNATEGFTVGLGGVVFSIGSTLEANDNGTDGVLLLQNGAVELIGGRLEAHRNAGDGITVREQSTLTLGIAEFGVEGTVVALGNEGHGMSVLDGSLVVVDGIMPVTSRENLGSGLVVDAGSTANIRGSTFADNAEPDVERFAARATLNDNIIGEFVCDETSLRRGSDVCP